MRVSRNAAILAAIANVARASQPTAFLVMGDWGGDEHAPYCTTSETDTAKGMNAAAKDMGAEFGVALGDNFYHAGVKSVDDPRFQETFENVFVGDALSAKSGFMFHLVAGNHDHIGDVNAQIEYTTKSARWSFPSLYYTFTKTSADGATVQFVLLDTVILSGNSQFEQDGQVKQRLGHELQGPASQQKADDQMKWLDATLKASTADYLLVGGHYPVYSVCEHGPTRSLQEHVKPLLEKYKVTAYLAGHDHCSEHIDVGNGVQYHGIGSAAYHVASEAHKKTIKSDQLKFHDGVDAGGFASVVVTKSSLLLTHHDGTGNHLYNNTMFPRGKTSVIV